MAGEAIQSESQQDPRVRNLRKKIAQIEALEQKCQANGSELSEDQLEKVARKAEFEAELQQLLEPPPKAVVDQDSDALAGPASEEQAEPSPETNTESLAEITSSPAKEAGEEAADEAAGKAAEDAADEDAPEDAADEAVDQAKEAGEEAAEHVADEAVEQAVAVKPTPKKVKQTPTAAEAATEAPAASQVDPRVRSLRKKLVQIEGLEQKLQDGVELSEEQLEKIERKAEIEAEIENILNPPKAPEPEAETKVDAEAESEVGEWRRYFVQPDFDAYSIFESPHSFTVIGTLQIGDCVWAKREAEDVDGYQMVMLKEGGAVDMNILSSEGVISSKSKRPRKKKANAAAADAAEESKPGSLKLDLEVAGSGGLQTPSMSPSMCRSPGLMACRSPSMRWQDDPVSVEDIAPPVVPKEEPCEFIENIQPFSQVTQSSERLKAIMKEVSLLSHDAFEEDALAMVTRKGGWKMTLLVRPEGSVDATDLPLDDFSLDDTQTPSLIGFLVYRLRPELESLSIAKLAIVPEHRQQGHGRRLIEWCMKSAKKQPSIAYISLSSLPEAVKFYHRIGFRAPEISLEKAAAAQCGPDDELVEGQVYMEYRVKGRGRARKK